MSHQRLRAADLRLAALAVDRAVADDARVGAAHGDQRGRVVVDGRTARSEQRDARVDPQGDARRDGDGTGDEPVAGSAGHQLDRLPGRTRGQRLLDARGVEGGLAGRRSGDDREARHQRRARGRGQRRLRGQVAVARAADAATATGSPAGARRSADAGRRTPPVPPTVPPVPVPVLPPVGVVLIPPAPLLAPPFPPPPDGAPPVAGPPPPAAPVSPPHCRRYPARWSMIRHRSPTAMTRSPSKPIPKATTKQRRSRFMKCA